MTFEDDVILSWTLRIVAIDEDYRTALQEFARKLGSHWSMLPRQTAPSGNPVNRKDAERPRLNPIITPYQSRVFIYRHQAPSLLAG